MSDIEKTKILVLVMTYPLPSRGYQELVCTAGITEAAEWVRLYPIDYRYRPRDQQFNLACAGRLLSTKADSHCATDVVQPRLNSLLC